MGGALCVFLCDNAFAMLLLKRDENSYDCLAQVLLVADSAKCFAQIQRILNGVGLVNERNTLSDEDCRRHVLPHGGSSAVQPVTGEWETI